ncbi:S-layer homology domain-containing protein [Paenibacillus sp. yr247]|uniref:S-layer homology domain-containing protein n=1 Tax=Paenibacillus sp. yr247 TaxID=1761880 RepID=UPI00088BC0C8|nr:S-layer homology domain-containing protein [Paenibacillus sp. yr247]SDO53847.1 S-layer homology domain-containing protein [Paenibacillus sp. yr247]
MKKIFCSILVGALVSLCLASFGWAAGNGSPSPTFKDVPKAHWANDSINWGKEKHLLDGFEDGTFRPDNEVSEEQFLKIILSLYFPNGIKPTDSSWSSGFYGFAKDMKYKLPGVADQQVHSQNVNRLTVATIIANFCGFRSFKDDSAEYVQFLFDNKMSTGKTDMTFDGYAPYDTLTRAEAVQFVRNISKILDKPHKANYDIGAIKENNASVQDIVARAAEKYGYKTAYEYYTPNGIGMRTLGVYKSDYTQDQIKSNASAMVFNHLTSNSPFVQVYTNNKDSADYGSFVLLAVGLIPHNSDVPQQDLQNVMATLISLAVGGHTDDVNKFVSDNFNHPDGAIAKFDGYTVLFSMAGPSNKIAIYKQGE